MIHFIRYTLLFFAIYSTFLFDAESINAQLAETQLKSLVLKDESLVVAGIGTTGLVLGMMEKEVVLIKGKPFLKTEKVDQDLLADVLKVRVIMKLPFTHLYIYDNSNVIIGFSGDIVTFILVWHPQGVLIDGIPLSKGIASIVFNYGNDGLTVINDEKSSLYFYLERGVSFIDENGDNSVDGVLIFEKVVIKK